ncbi:MAG: LytTR family transcriptional regulator [Saprospiraceae bacterium]|jgi:two-component system LytT family response regulator|nr:LytTR family transcriptional regulator [Saprospiraceae bacterium]MBK6478275.1 LytTR family transcriptional regulator [Saprospiraceae bacterium]MBK6480423.1 LytTR family transcriptional regulator [Saprospiraceae bacterium]MBK6817203.1 LytTR family transcriptional regulator [Saprospiraceae bacterium]MBK7371754.1 LytTR family transcriptional regulator [Saprospiraceae bacterium]
MNNICLNNQNQIELPGPNDLIINIDLSEVCRINGMGPFTQINLLDGRNYTCAVALSFFEDLLHTHTFYKVHASHLINKVHVKKIITGEEDAVIMYDGAKLPISRRIKADFIAVMQDWALQKMYNSIAV